MQEKSFTDFGKRYDTRNNAAVNVHNGKILPFYARNLIFQVLLT